MLHLSSCDLIGDEFVELLEDSNVPENAFWWCRGRINAKLSGKKPEKRLLVESNSGRVFWSQGEMRWKALSSQTRVVWIGDVSTGLKDLPEKTLEAKNVREYVHILGHQHVLDFSSLPPMQNTDLLCVIRTEYRTIDQGVFSRFNGVVAKSPDELKEYPVERKDA